MTTEITEEEIVQLSEHSCGKLSEGFCRLMVYFLIGYLKYPEPDNNYAYHCLRQHFYRQLKEHLEKSTAHAN